MVRNPRKEKVNNHKKRTDKKLESLRTREYLTTEDAQIFVILCVCAGYLGTSSLKSSKGVPKTKKNALEKVLSSAEWAGRKTSKQKTQSFGHESRFECAMPKYFCLRRHTLFFSRNFRGFVASSSRWILGRLGLFLPGCTFFVSSLSLFVLPRNNQKPSEMYASVSLFVVVVALVALVNGFSPKSARFAPSTRLYEGSFVVHLEINNISTVLHFISLLPHLNVPRLQIFPPCGNYLHFALPFLLNL